MSQKKKTPRRSSHGPLTLEDLHLQCEESDALARRYGSLTVAQERYEELLERGDLTGAPWECEAWWVLNAPAELHDRPDKDPRNAPEIYAAQERMLEEFEELRAVWLEVNGYS